MNVSRHQLSLLLLVSLLSRLSFAEDELVAEGISTSISGRVCPAPELSTLQRDQDRSPRGDFTFAFKSASAWVVSIGAGDVVFRQTDTEIDQKKVFEARSIGSGIIWGQEQYILTNYHIIRDHPQLRARTLLGQRVRLELVGFYEALDIALLRTQEGIKLKTKSACYSMRTPTPGMWVAALGHPYGMPFSLSTGAVSALYRGENFTDWSAAFPGFIQSDLVLNRGNSGGPLIDLQGTMLGMNTAIHGSASGVSFTLPLNRILPVIKQLIDHGRFERSYVGMTLSSMSYSRSEKMGLKPKQGVRVRRVIAGGPANLAGILPDDVILSINGEPYEHHDELSWAMVSSPVGIPILLEVARSSENTSIMYTLLTPSVKQRRAKTPPRDRE